MDAHRVGGNASVYMYITNVAPFSKAFPIIARYADRLIAKLDQTELEDSTDLKKYDLVCRIVTFVTRHGRIIFV